MTRYYGQHEPPVDKILEGLLPAGFIGRAVDVGAADGITDSNTYLFEQFGWQVLCVEPNPSYLGSLTANRKLVVPAAASYFMSESERFDLFRMDGGWGAISGLRPDARLVEEYKSSIRDHWWVYVRVRTLDQLLAEAAFPSLDLLSVDTEGTELDVLLGLDFTKWKPLVIVSENNWDEPRVKDYLSSVGYRHVRRNVVNDFYVREG